MPLTYKTKYSIILSCEPQEEGKIEKRGRDEQMEKPVRGIRFMLVLAACILGCFAEGQGDNFSGNGIIAQAAVKDVQVTNGNTTEITVSLGDTGYIRPVMDLPGVPDIPDTPSSSDTPNTPGTPSTSGTPTPGTSVAPGTSGGLPTAAPVTVARWVYDSYDDEIVRVDANGYYEAVAYGKATIAVYGYTEYGALVFRGTCHVNVCVDMTNVTLETDRLTGYVAGYDSFSAKIKINSAVLLGEDNSVMTYQSDEPDMSLSCELANNELTISAYGEGKARMTVIINGKEFQISVKVIRIEMSKSSLVTSRGKKAKLSIKGTKEKAKWTSSNAKAVKVSGDGTVRCKKTGNAVITAQIGGVKAGCAVSVVSPKLLKVVKKAKMIGANWKYSQPKRMQKGYYDCSSLVWKCYKTMGKTFGNRSYAPVAADEAKWCASHKKMITKSYTWKQIQKMKLRPGDVIFKTGQKNGRYKGIYHVEMFVGYNLTGFDSSGKPLLSELWAARSEGYGGGGYPVARP